MKTQSFGQTLDQAPPNFRFHNETDEDLEVSTSDSAVYGDASYRSVDARDSALVSVSTGCPGIALVVRRPQGVEVARVEMAALCERTDIHYYGPDDIRIDP